MRILVDGDSCPVIKEVQEVARKFGIDLFIYTDIYHDIYLNYGKMIRVDCQNQSTDNTLFNDCRPDDIVVTGDYGLAAMVMGKNAVVINFNGKVFSSRDIDVLLMRRHIHSKIRRGGGRHPTPKKRSREHNLHFKKSLTRLINKKMGIIY
ncbi:YaiI/YqxD family protein [Halothermothrix orenii]|uniref:Uncharacterized protein conserved in bacteria n=1 Tax=Halothermothrix orenii (strain H 168 / OCM 544 / DSM 9562) TaxID=373903 RepID=B8CWB2_HALOH|nr:DUF188 domain-containing protein [Halothermothrix orenii]ACL69581.1 uncharacterized protein conserved in bacteria [Halothermothrix orenii H 168]